GPARRRPRPPFPRRGPARPRRRARLVAGAAGRLGEAGLPTLQGEEAQITMELQTLLQTMVNKRGSDLHIRANCPAYLRVDGALEPVGERCTGQEVEAMLNQVMTPRAKKLYQERGETDFSFQAGEVARFRVNAFRQRQQLCMAIRFVSMKIPTLEELK